MLPDKIERVLETLPWWGGEPLAIDAAAQLAEVAVFVIRPEVLPRGRPAESADTPELLAHLLRERATYGVPVAVVPGFVAVEFCLRFPDSAPNLRAAPGGPADALRYKYPRYDDTDEERALGLIDPQLAEAESFMRHAFVSTGLGLAEPVVVRDGQGPLVWGKVEVSWPHLGGLGNAVATAQGVLVYSDGQLIVDRGYDGSAERHVSWLVVWIDQSDGSGRRGVRFRGDQVTALLALQVPPNP